jgi:hypothetical protein
VVLHGHIPNGDILINMLPTMTAWRPPHSAKMPPTPNANGASGEWNGCSGTTRNFRTTRQTDFSRLGIRESVRVRGEYVLTQNDLTAGLSGQTHADIIAIADHAIDSHGGSTAGGEVPQPYGIPYRCPAAARHRERPDRRTRREFQRDRRVELPTLATMMQLGEAAGRRPSGVRTERNAARSAGGRHPTHHERTDRRSRHTVTHKEQTKARYTLLSSVQHDRKGLCYD